MRWGVRTPGKWGPAAGTAQPLMQGSGRVLEGWALRGEASLQRSSRRAIALTLSWVGLRCQCGTCNASKMWPMRGS